MASINRGTLPQNFLDSVSADIMLPTPEPAYSFARMAMAGRLSLAAIDAGQPTVQQFVSMMGGGQAQDPALDSLARFADTFPGALTVVDQLFGLGKGDTIKFPRDIFEGGGYSKSGRRLTSDATISTTGQNIKNEEVPLILEQYHGPYNSSASAVRPYAIEDFAAKYQANKFKLADKVSRHLRRDYTKWLDRVIRDEFLKSGNVTLPTGVANGATFVAGGNCYITLEQILNARKALTDREWQPFGNGRYVCLVPTTFNTQMVQDPDYKELSKFHGQDRNQLFGYIGSIQDVDLFECTTLAHYSDNGGDDAATLEGSTVGAGVVLDEAILFGPGAVGFGTAAAPECRWADDTNYGTVAKVIWYALHAFGMLDDRGVQRIVYQGVDA